MKKIAIFISLLGSLLISAQVSFEKAYFISKTGERIECLIKDYDWRSNPNNFEYKLSDTSPVKNMKTSDVQLFEIYNRGKFISEKVKIDKSSSDLSKLSGNREPNYVEEELFLKEIVNGKADLYEYVDGPLVRYFYKLNEDKPTQLIYKAYDHDVNQVAYNKDYIMQLQKDLNCDGFSKNSIESSKYRKFDLTRIFTNYNKCSDPNFKQESKETKKFTFGLAVIPRLNSQSLSLENPFEYTKFTLGNKMTFGIGIELEAVLPFNKGKWAIIMEPNYQQYKGEATISVPYQESRSRYTKAEYKAIEVPIGIRHYIFLDTTSKISVNILYGFDFGMNSNVEYGRDGYKYYDYELKMKSAFQFGLGYKYNNKYSVEARYGSKKIQEPTQNWTGKYDNFSLIISYNIF